jgi:hypothetical protein
LKIPSDASFSPYADTLLSDGFCLLPQVLSAAECRDFIAQYDREQCYRSTVDMARYNFGSGQYRYFDTPLPERIARLRARFYELLVQPARVWAQRVKVDDFYPATFADFERSQHLRNQTKPTPLILRYTSGDYNCLHQDIFGENYFPYQMIFFLSQQGRDFEGGELILTQQRPRMQTIPHIVKPDRGDSVIVASKYHPCAGKRGNYRTTFKHGVGKITSGERYSLGIIFHNYAERAVVK